MPAPLFYSSDFCYIRTNGEEGCRPQRMYPGMLFNAGYIALYAGFMKTAQMMVWREDCARLFGFSHAREKVSVQGSARYMNTVIHYVSILAQEHHFNCMSRRNVDSSFSSTNTIGARRSVTVTHIRESPLEWSYMTLQA